MSGAMDVPSVKKVWRRMTGVAAASPQVAIVSELQATRTKIVQNKMFQAEINEHYIAFTHVGRSMRNTIYGKQCANHGQ